MIKFIKNMDTFNRNMLLVFIGTSLVNVFSLFYQLLVAHSLSAADFAGFNALLAISMIISTSLQPLQTAVAKYSAGFQAHGESANIRELFTRLLKNSVIISIATLIAFYYFSVYIVDKLKIPSAASGYILAALLATSWLTAVLFGAMQGLQLFAWLTSVLVITGAVKLVFGYMFVSWGFNIAGALNALLLASILGILLPFLPLKGYIKLSNPGNTVRFREFYRYLVPVSVASFCFINLVSLDMVLVKYFFKPQDSGAYSLAQLVGKIFLFLPFSISVVMLPSVSGLSAKKMDTAVILRKSLFYAAALCVLSASLYNCFPEFVLKTLSGKVFPESVLLGRLFSVSMSFFTLAYILITYFLSIHDTRFLKYLAVSTVLQCAAIIMFHASLVEVQLILCVNAAILFFTLLSLTRKAGHNPAKAAV